MGWLFPLLFAALILVAMVRFAKSPRAALELAVVAALIALAGYAWQGSPGLPGSPRESTARL